MKVKKYYKITGKVLGNCWGGGKVAYQSESYEGKNLDELMKKINEDLESGALDSGMGYESLIGALMTVETIETITANGKKYHHSEYESEFIGKLSEEEEDFMFECDW